MSLVIELAPIVVKFGVVTLAMLCTTLLFTILAVFLMGRTYGDALTYVSHLGGWITSALCGVTFLLFIITTF